jgi:hypothetical protein
VSGQHRTARERALSLIIVLVALAPIAPAGWHTVLAAQETGCTLGAEIRATTCRLVDGRTVEGALADAAGSATYRVDALGPDTALDLVVAGSGGSIRVTVVDWRGTVLGQAVRSDDAPEARLSARLPQPGAYGVQVDGDALAASPTYRLGTALRQTGPVVSAAWPRSLADGDAPLTGERQIVRTPRGGTSLAGVAVARALGAPPDGEVGDFTLVADVQFEQIVGPSAFTVRFRYEPEAGGGSGYLFSLDPFGGTVSLDSFEEGQRRSIVGHSALPFMPTSDGPNRLIVRAEGSAIRVTLDGQTVLEATDSRYPRGLIAVGAVTWSDPVAVTFDHIQVTTSR